MRFATSVSVAAMSLAGMATAAPHGSAIVIVEASHGGAGNDLTNTTISVPIGSVYNDNPALEKVSTLYLDSTLGVPSDTVTCTPYQATNGQGTHGNAFDTTFPSRLSTNTVVVGSIVCNSSA